MSVIANIHMESDLSEWTATVTDSGDLAWSASAALAGTSGGMACLVDDTTAIYATKSGLNDTSNKVRIRFYLDPNSCTMTDPTQTAVLAFYNTAMTVLGYVRLVYSGGSFRLNVRLFNDGGSGGSSTNVAISDGPHYIEIYAQRAATSSSADGSLAWWIDGMGQTSLTGVDNYDAWAQVGAIRAGVGMVTGVPSGMSGTIYIDEILANNDGSEIGAYSSTVTGAASLAGAVTYSGAALNVVQSSASMAGVGGWAGASLLNIPAIGQASGAGGALGAGLVNVLAQAQAAGVGMAQGTSLLLIPGSAGLDGSGALDGAPVLAVIGAAAMQGAGALDTAALLLVPAAGGLDGSGALAGDAVLTVPGAGQMAGSGLLNGGAILIVPLAGQLDGAGLLTGDGVDLGAVIVGAAQLAGGADLTGAAGVHVLGTAILSGLAGVSGSASLTVLGVGALAGAGDASGAVLLIVQAVSSLLGSGALQAAGRIVLLTAITPDGRTFVVPIDVRQYSAPVDDRAFAVMADDRTFEAPA